MGIPSATYRLQMNRDFPLAQANAIVPYLADLGAGAAYLSPIVMARPGSSHGYDVVDLGRLNPELGNDAEMSAFATNLKDHGLGLLVDVVPNHMSIWGSANHSWNDVLENGPSSPFARWFDIDWTPPKPDLEAKILLPVLGDQFGRVLEAGDIRVAYKDGAFVANYHDLTFPVAPKTWPQILNGALARLRPSMSDASSVLLELESIITSLEHLPPRTETDRQRVRERLRDREISRRRIDAHVQKDPRVSAAIDDALVELNGRPEDPRSFDALEALLSEQGYRLSHWRVAAEEINYRRFFDINELAAVRVEEPAVFDAVHEVLLRLVREGQVSGVRVDHVDGLWDPQAYLARLRRVLTTASGGETLYTVVEKILEPGERLPASWPVHGTTGYDFLNLAGGVFVYGEGVAALRRLEARLAQEPRRFADVAYEAKKLVLDVALSAELTVLSRRLDRISEQHRSSRDFTLQSLQGALAEVIACFPVYRTYVRAEDETIGDEDRAHVEAAVRSAKRRNPTTSPSIFDFVRSLLLLEAPEGLEPIDLAERRDFVLRLQQLTAPVMAKGLEDTSFYRYFPLAALNEVGGPIDARGISVEQLHHENAERLRLSPTTMSTTATHDTKRGEDVRARLFALTELSDEWIDAVDRWREQNRRHKRDLVGDATPDDLTEYLLYQTILGAWPAESPASGPSFVARLQAYMTKASREAKLHTSWINPNQEHEDAVAQFVATVLDPAQNARFIEDIGQFQKRLATLGYYTSLAQTLLKIASPGVPDIYQGNELWDLSLVDPDNRRPVDYESRRTMLAELRRDADVDAGALAEHLLGAPSDGRVKLFLTYRALGLRRARSDVFEAGPYSALSVLGARSRHAIAFSRGEGRRSVIAIFGRFFAALTEGGCPPIGSAAWGDTCVSLATLFPAGQPTPSLRDAVSGHTLNAEIRNGQPVLPLFQVFAHLPVALLEAAA
ncbi:MAG: malto-oligosyltrehalose synthase [Vicinamibacteria bacterium]|nr:malto-oligosyltrehalose synthase [Vicinamibacteria bacterium]